MTIDERLPWFHCYPSKLLGALASMKPDQKLVYLVMLLRIYEVRGPCPDTIDAIAIRCSINRRRTSEALDALFKAGKLVREGNGIINSFAANVLAKGDAMHRERQRAGSAGGFSRAEKTKSIQRPSPSKAKADAKHLDLDIEEEKKERKNSKRRATALHPLPDDWTLSDTDIAYATKRGFTAAQIESMSAAFSNHHTAKGSLMARWDAAWRTWVENEIRFQRQRNGGSNEVSRGSQQPSLNLGYGAIAAKLKARRLED